MPPDLSLSQVKITPRHLDRKVSVAWYLRTASRLQPPEAGANLPSSPRA
jgi:hypothetical protein